MYNLSYYTSHKLCEQQVPRTWIEITCVGNLKHVLSCSSTRIVAQFKIIIFILDANGLRRIISSIYSCLLASFYINCSENFVHASEFIFCPEANMLLYSSYSCQLLSFLLYKIVQKIFFMHLSLFFAQKQTCFSIAHKVLYFSVFPEVADEPATEKPAAEKQGSSNDRGKY